MPSVYKNKRSVINRLIFDYLISHKYIIFLALLMMIISAAATGLHAWLVRPALDEVLIKGNKEMLFLIPLAIIIVTLCKGIATYTHSFQMSKVAHSVIAKLQTHMFEKLMYLNLNYFNDSKSGPSNVPSLDTLVVRNSLNPYFINSFVASNRSIPVFFCHP